MEKSEKISIAVIVVLILTLIVCVVISRNMDRTKVDRDYKALYDIEDLVKERNALSKELDALDSKYLKNVKISAMEEFLILSADERVYGEIFPRFSEAGIVGVLALSPSEMPGKTGKLTNDQLETMVNAGWEVAIAIKEGDDAESLITEMRNKLKTYGVLPVCVYFEEGAYSADCDKYLKAAGIEIAVCASGEGENPTAEEYESGEVWKAGARPWNGSGIRLVVDDAVKNTENIVYTMDFGSTERLFKADGFERLLEYIAPYLENGRLKVTTISAARDVYKSAWSAKSGNNLEYEEQRAEIEAKMEELDRQIAESST